MHLKGKEQKGNVVEYLSYIVISNMQVKYEDNTLFGSNNA